MNRQQLLASGISHLVAAGIDGAAQDARRLLAAAIGCPSDRLSLHLAEPTTEAEEERFTTFITARAAHQPVAQIIGKRMFWGRAFIVTPDVLDPRPETETLVAHALQEPARRILDLGSGTGCIALSLLAEWPTATAVLADVSTAALAVAQRNADALEVSGRCECVASDWYTAIEGQFDLIVSNPPYISAAEMRTLSADVVDWEPHVALTPGGDGLDAYRAIAGGVTSHIAPGGRLMLEIGPSQANAVSDLVAATRPADLSVLQDLDGRDRVVCAVY
ncbi:peptide chain release factor N(5)-glutamine methyltransferase [Algicella marina]|uniref:Release factor glutamine methyltransferase n=1 Tax=Algicella marina TaxID=2683284 RepID=A0A6P1SZX3_9RHOB|nr:peptide chain release factor N(5)-glutamine methyltransferase [Algicella marina]QHQ34923.1 peptide chain release factor N(5)-glutamine methyltransferase [Algicella marina]